MSTQKIIDDVAAKVNELLAQSPAKDIEKNVKAMLSGVFSRLDLVTREEFDVQAEVLARTRETLAALEARIATLEGKPTPAPDSGN
jgi:hypothetical protein